MPFAVLELEVPELEVFSHSSSEVVLPESESEPELLPLPEPLPPDPEPEPEPPFPPCPGKAVGKLPGVNELGKFPGP